MLALLSPSKTLDYDRPVPKVNGTQPLFIQEASTLAKTLKKYSSQDLQELMGISEKLGDLNFERYQNFQLPLNDDNARAAIFAFKGDVYDNMTADTYTEEDMAFAQKSIGILSGMYGLLRPTDYLYPYRLEMGTALPTDKGDNLYQFWGSKITDAINQQEKDVVVNLASNEYFKAVNKKDLKPKCLDIVFKQNKGGKLKTLGLMAKRARGMMADYIVKNRINDPADLLKFDMGGYRFMPDMSKDNSFVFVMDMD